MLNTPFLFKWSKHIIIYSSHSSLLYKYWGIEMVSLPNNIETTTIKSSYSLHNLHNSQLQRLGKRPRETPWGAKLVVRPAPPGSSNVSVRVSIHLSSGYLVAIIVAFLSSLSVCDFVLIDLYIYLLIHLRVSDVLVTGAAMKCNEMPCNAI